MAKLLVALLAIIVAVEVVVGLVVIGALFWLGSPQTIGLGAMLLVAAALTSFLVVRYMRSGRSAA